MQIQQLFERDVTREIPPVVYFHEQSPQRLREEVEEYIITGGYPAGDPRARRVERGIHEGFVSLLTGIKKALGQSGGPDLPASWISGFYGSGKSSFAKLLGMALDGVVLDDGTPLAEALLRRDESPRRQELVDAWHELVDTIEPIAVVFDIGAVARDNEQIHSAALRKLQERLGYSKNDQQVANHELKLERDGAWPDFLAAAEATLGRPWSEANLEHQVDELFSQVMHALYPERYTSAMAWVETWAGTGMSIGTSPVETIDAMAAMLEHRAAGKTLFLVIDEVSQYVHQSDTRMLRLQSFVSELGKRLRGRLRLPVGEGWSEVLFRLEGGADEQVRVQVLHPDGVEQVEPYQLPSWFAVAGRTAVVATAPVADTAAAAEDDWSAALPDDGTRQLFRHLDRHGAVSEEEAITMLGSPRKLRRFSDRFEELRALTPLQVRIEVTERGKRYVKEGGGR